MAPVIQPASSFARMFGVKQICYGPPGTGKTPIIDTAPRPILMAVEPGLLSMRRSNTPTALCDTPAKVDDFFQWLFNSAEARNYDTVGIDSASEISYRYLVEAKASNKDGRKAYGVMSDRLFPHLSNLFYMQQKHVYIICKQTVDEAGKRIPQFEGQDLRTKVPHLYDLITHLDRVNIPQVGEQLAFRTKGAFDISARDRSGVLNEFEPPHLGNLFNKILQG